MTTSQPNVRPNDRLELRDAAKALKVNRSTIIRWTASGKLHCGKRKGNGRNFWSGAEILKFWQAEY